LRTEIAASTSLPRFFAWPNVRRGSNPAARPRSRERPETALSRHSRVAADLPALAPERGGSTLSGHSARRMKSRLFRRRILQNQALYHTNMQLPHPIGGADACPSDRIPPERRNKPKDLNVERTHYGGSVTWLWGTYPDAPVPGTRILAINCRMRSSSGCFGSLPKSMFGDIIFCSFSMVAGFPFHS